MWHRDENKLSRLVFTVCVVLPHAAHAQSEIIDGWTDLLLSVSRLVIVFAAFLGIAYSAISLFRAYNADAEQERTRHLMAALFAGSFTIIGVIIGWISGLLFPVAT